ncbi:hypothetical protein BJV85_002456 [Clostridium acetobutylicum]|uniref:Uncharacterized protein n=1 Tax=Clostridium acetobutylicum (strain ATCC 824 / DSM 792 / JCM 1419 / IAM 19013 / LMG 5710 / NBRC 13948 / NRRL B-527 / VKM B-1787 / 2291 / W) TaxID=272562 RepID=Q97IU9_CLOAB|nr:MULTISPECIES: hypothetical protein [Clostridium]AAK79508.1 Hypothetical protein, CF-36 family [Clostridium acetobutylicum ATCC 824]ADZ20593.1 conserved hypothetical protein [Clostridium acetobutylicum EA 2018]AEI31862.1 hypothetical protein SMB_G1566 [Clostridium acetobutylicum DSM 1731]AWV81246.1 hypothetical protein DK921_14335 [Clostridium acetobutylicum]KHD36282.1 hypothetical protein NL50_10975 [Clostridium acetobutylicum]
MSKTEIIMLFTIIGIILGVLITMLSIFPLLKKNGIKVSDILEETQKVVDASDKVLGVASEVFPKSGTVNILEIIDKWAKIAVGSAEQLSHAGDISKDERAEVAENVVLDVLKELNINVDDNKKALIDAAIKNAVNDLGHSSSSKVVVNSTSK